MNSAEKRELVQYNLNIKKHAILHINKIQITVLKIQYSNKYYMICTVDPHKGAVQSLRPQLFAIF